MPQNSMENLVDDSLRAAVLKAFSIDETIGQTNLRVGVLNAVVHLGGSVPSLEVRVKAERIAAGFPGVRGVVNRIEAPGAPEPSRTVNLDLS